MKRFPLGLLAVVVLLSLGTGIGSAMTTARVHRSTAEQVEVIGASAVCPELRQLDTVLATRVSVGSGPLPAGRTSSGGTIEAHQVDKPAAGLTVPVTRSGEVAVELGTKTNNDGLRVSAAGDLAAALEVEQVARGERGSNRGLAGLRCEPPRPESWFVGGSTAVGNRARLVLANIDDTAASVDITVFTNTGRVDAEGGLGVSVPAHHRIGVELDTLAPGKKLLSLHVVATRGRVAAGLFHSVVTPVTTHGVDWVPPAEAPATKVVVPGFSTGTGERNLLITNPGTDDTTVSVQVTTQDGQFVPTGRDAVLVPAGRVVAVSLTDLSLASPLAATVTSDGAPILAAGVSIDTQGTPVQELAYTTGAPPLSGPALLTDLVINRPTESTLILSAPLGSATVQVTPIQVLGQTGALPPAKKVKVSAGRTTTLRLSTFFKPGTNAQLAVEVRPLPGSGPVYAARYLRERGAHGPLSTELVLTGPAQLVSRPAVHGDAQVGTP